MGGVDETGAPPISGHADYERLPSPKIHFCRWTRTRRSPRWSWRSLPSGAEAVDRSERHLNVPRGGLDVHNA